MGDGQVLRFLVHGGFKFQLLQEQSVCELIVSILLKIGGREGMKSNASGSQNKSQLQNVLQQSSRQLIHAGNQEDHAKEERHIDNISNTVNLRCILGKPFKLFEDMKWHKCNAGVWTPPVPWNGQLLGACQYSECLSGFLVLDSETAKCTHVVLFQPTLATPPRAEGC